MAPALGPQRGRRATSGRRRARVGLAACAVQGAHEQAAGAPTLRRVEEERLQIGNRVGGPVELEKVLGALLARGLAQFVEPDCLGLCKRAVGELGESVAPPQRKGVVDAAGGE